MGRSKMLLSYVLSRSTRPVLHSPSDHADSPRRERHSAQETRSAESSLHQQAVDVHSRDYAVADETRDESCVSRAGHCLREAVLYNGGKSPRDPSSYSKTLQARSGRTKGGPSFTSWSRVDDATGKAAAIRRYT